MKTIKMIMLFVSISAVAQASNDNVHRVIFGTALATCVTTGGVLAWRSITAHQDKKVVGKINTYLKNTDNYDNAAVIIDKPVRDFDLEDKINSVATTICCTDSMYCNSINQKITDDVRDLQGLQTWDLWMRSWFNPIITDAQDALEDKAANINKAKEFLLQEHRPYFYATSLAAECEQLITSIDSNGSIRVMSCNRYTPHGELSGAVSFALRRSGKFSNHARPYYACYEALFAKSEQLSAAIASLPCDKSNQSKYKNLACKLGEAQLDIMALYEAIKCTREYQEQKDAQEQEMRQKKEAERQEKLLKVQQQATRAAERQAHAAEAQLIVDSQRLAIERQRLTAEEFGRAVRKRMLEQGISERQATQDLEQERALSAACNALLGLFLS